MRVIAGKYKGRVLKGPKHEGLRPTADRVKEALFNIIGSRIIDASFLDLFAGSGAIGIEALSRDAASVVMVDENKQSIKLIYENCGFLTEEDQPRILNMPALRALQLISKEALTFDLIFLDPPFQKGLLDNTINKIAELKLLKPGGLVVAEHSRDFQFGELQWDLIESRNYGDIGLTFFN